MQLQPETRAGPWYLKAGLTTPQINTLKQVLILEMESGRNLALAWSAPIARLSVFSDLSCLHLWCKIYIPANTLRWNIWPCHSLDTKILTLEMVSKKLLGIRAARNDKKYIYIFRIFCLDYKALNENDKCQFCPVFWVCSTPAVQLFHLLLFLLMLKIT